MKPTVYNVKNVYLTSEVAELLGYEPNYLLRVAKGLMEAGIITEEDGRPAGNRNYLFNEKAVFQLQLKLNPKTYYLTSSEDYSCIHLSTMCALGIFPPSDGWIALDDSSLVQACKEAVDDGALDEFLEEHDLDSSEHYFICDTEEDIVNLEFLNEKMLNGHLYNLETLNPVTWEEFLSCERFVYQVDKNGQLMIEEVEAELRPLNEEKTLFKNKKTDEYVMYASFDDSHVNEAVEFSASDDCVPYLDLKKEDLYQALANDFDLTVHYKTFEHWDNQPYFETENGEIIEIMSTSVIGNSLTIGQKDVYHLVEDIQTAI